MDSGKSKTLLLRTPKSIDVTNKYTFNFWKLQSEHIFHVFSVASIVPIKRKGIIHILKGITENPSRDTMNKVVKINLFS
ncbi:MAG: Glu-tRNA(Gln) amidotransferase subunit E-like FAD-binding protein [Alphaproteobacteria bacterium]|jgi:Glu-tRNA(Gln) amidotransferase subunit E-like FAD-binding protein